MNWAPDCVTKENMRISSLMFLRAAAVRWGWRLPSVWRCPLLAPEEGATQGELVQGIVWHSGTGPTASLLRVCTLLSFEGAVSGELLLLFLFEMSVVHVKPKPYMEILMMVSVEHLVPFMNATMLVQQELSLKSIFTGVEVPEERENPMSEVQEYWARQQRGCVLSPRRWCFPVSAAGVCAERPAEGSR